MELLLSLLFWCVDVEGSSFLTNYIYLFTNCAWLCLCPLQLYDLDNNRYDEMDVVQIYYDVTNKYKKANSRFMGAKVIYAPLRIANDSHFLHYLDVCRRLHVSTLN